MIDIELQRARSAMAESVTLPIAMWLEALDELEALRQTRLVQQAEQEPVAIVEDWPTDSTPKGIVALCDIKELPAGTLLYASPATSTEVFTREKVDSLLIAAYTKGRNDLLEKQPKQEPVASVDEWVARPHPEDIKRLEEQRSIGYWDSNMNDVCWREGLVNADLQHGQPLYTTPVRTKDLTDDEIWELAKSSEGKSRQWLVWAVIDKIKEKNK